MTIIVCFEADNKKYADVLNTDRFNINDFYNSPVTYIKQMLVCGHNELYKDVAVDSMYSPDTIAMNKISITSVCILPVI
jgi:hypothetical protein